VRRATELDPSHSLVILKVLAATVRLYPVFSVIVRVATAVRLSCRCLVTLGTDIGIDHRVSSKLHPQSSSPPLHRCPLRLQRLNGLATAIPVADHSYHFLSLNLEVDIGLSCVITDSVTPLPHIFPLYLFIDPFRLIHPPT